MPDKSWKRAERVVAKTVGGQRNPLSGRNSRHTGGDVIHPKLYVEVKYRQNFAVTTLMREVEAAAKKEGKLPWLGLQPARLHTRYYVIRESELELVIKAISTMPDPDEGYTL